VCDHGRVRRWIGVAVAAVVALAAVAITAKIQRDREWAHGGDSVNVSGVARIAETATFDATVAALGGPHGHHGSPTGLRPMVVRVDWTTSTFEDGSYHLIALDKRSYPPRPLATQGGWNISGTTGGHWSSAYNALSEHYDWLAGTAPVVDSQGRVSLPWRAVSAPASPTGTLTAWFATPDDQVPVIDPSVDLFLALFYTDKTGFVRWAKRISV
jgi:hypothetical protein